MYCKGYRIQENTVHRYTRSTSTMPKRGGGKPWSEMSHAPALTLSDAKREIKAMDRGTGGHWKTCTGNPGNGTTTAVMQCNAHLECQYLVRTVRRANGLYAFEQVGTHSDQVNDKKRSNSALTFEQERSASASFLGTGSKPAHVQTALTLVREEELKSLGADPLSEKKAQGGLSGAAASMYCHNTVFRQYGILLFLVRIVMYLVRILRHVRNTVFQYVFSKRIVMYLVRILRRCRNTVF